MKKIMRCLWLVMPISPFRLVIYLLLSLPSAVLPAVMLYLQQRIVDSVADVNLEIPLSHYMLPVLLLIAVHMAMKLFELAARQYMEFGYFRYVFMGLDECIHAKSARIPLEYYDNAEYYRTVQNAKQASTFLVFTANLAVMSAVVICNLLTVGGYLTTLHPLLIVFVVLVSAPVMVEKLQGARLQSTLMEETAQAMRRKNYAASLLMTSDRKKELSHHGTGHYVADKYLAACGEINEKERKHVRRIAGIGFGFSNLKALFHGISIALIVWLLTRGSITIGGFSVLLSSFAVLTSAFVRLFDHAGEILQTSVMSEAFFTLMELEIEDGTLDIAGSASAGMPDMADGASGLSGGWEIARLEGVSYRYPGAQEFALKGISLTVRKGERIAIVGENGAGKTTLAKLLSGFLKPTEGSMLLGGISREQLREQSIFDQISAVYQDFGRYQLTLAENVYLGDIMYPDDIREKLENMRIREALGWAGIDLTEHPEKMLLGKEFGGTDLSGGQWQRLALARSYYRHRPILFLDEPTAAIDPLEEAALYGKLDELAQDRTVILVTHRLGAVRNADRILVMEGGRIIETGSFIQLLEKKGRFCHIWEEQVKWYKSKPV